MATWKLSFDDPLGRHLKDQQDAKDAAGWQDLKGQARKPLPVDGNGVRALVEHLAPQYEVDPSFAAAIAQVESNFNRRDTPESNESFARRQ